MQKTAINEEQDTRKARGGSDRVPVSAIMSREPITVHPETSVEAVVELFLANRISRVPVVTRDGKVVGIVSKTDVIEEIEAESMTETTYRSRAFPGAHEESAPICAEDVMTRMPMTLQESATVSRAAEVMAEHQLHGLPVVAKDGRVVGVVSSLDVLAWVAGMRL